MTLEEMRAIIRAVLSEHESRADRYFALAALWDVVGYLQLCRDRGRPVPEEALFRREIEALLLVLDLARVPDEHVGVQLALARLDSLREQPARVIEEGVVFVVKADVSFEAEVVRAPGPSGVGSSGSAAPTIVTSGGGAPPTIADGGQLPPGIDVRSRQPTFSEAQTSGMLPALESGQRCWWEHRHYPLRDGRWGAEVRAYEGDGAGVNVTPIYPPASAGYFATPEAARAYNVGMAKWYFDVSGGASPIRPVATGPGTPGSGTPPTSP